MTSIPRALLRAARSQLHPYMLLLTLLPLLIAALLWGGVLWSGGETAVNAIQHFLSNSSLASWVQQGAARIGLERVTWHWETFAAPVLFALLLVPAVVLSVVVIIGMIGAPLAVKHVSRTYPQVELKPGTGVLASIANALKVSLIFMFAWLLTLPLWLIPPLNLIVPLLLWGWLNYRVMLFDALAAHALPEERQRIVQRHRWSLLVIGVLVAGLIVGVAESVATGVLDPLVGGGTRDVVASVIILMTLLFKPHGLFGEEHIERV